MLTEDRTRLLFDLHHIPLRDVKATPIAVLVALNEWVFRTFEREWRIEASDFPLDYLAHGSLDRFDPDPDNPDDPIHDLPQIKAPHFVGRLCETKRCSYLAFVHRFCATCCKQKYRVEVKRRTVDVSGLQIPAGLGLFATSELKGMHYITHFATNPEIISEVECTLPPTLLHLIIVLENVDDSYIVYWKYADEHGTMVRIRCDARIMASDTLEKPGLARYAAISKNHANVKFVKHGSKMWGIAVRDGLTIAPRQEIFRSI